MYCPDKKTRNGGDDIDYGGHGVVVKEKEMQVRKMKMVICQWGLGFFFFFE